MDLVQRQETRRQGPPIARLAIALALALVLSVGLAVLGSLDRSADGPTGVGTTTTYDDTVQGRIGQGAHGAPIKQASFEDALEARGGAGPTAASLTAAQDPTTERAGTCHRRC